jgi:Oxidoreductase NAD-binding domain
MGTKLGLSHHAVSRPKEGEDWQYSTGYINENMIRERLFPAGPTTFAGICGPPAMVNAACLPNLQVCCQALAAPCRTLLQCLLTNCGRVHEGILRTDPASLRGHCAGSQSPSCERLCAVSRLHQLLLMTTASAGHSTRCIHALKPVSMHRPAEAGVQPGALHHLLMSPHSSADAIVRGGGRR